MKLAIYADNHWCQYSSIVRSRGDKYSTRLENQIESLNWVDRVAEEKGCYMTICLGDFFDKSNLNSEEISALSELHHSTICWYIVGNHEAGNESLQFSSAHLMNLTDSKVVDTPYKFDAGDTEVCVLPYYTESVRKPLGEIFGVKEGEKRIILSHNDISGIQYGQYVSTTGYSVSDIEDNCDLFINGHLHNGEKVSDKIINLGNLTGQNFSEDAKRYKHCVMILDTDTLDYELIENPYAFNFYKLTLSELEKIHIKSNAVVTVTVPQDESSHSRCKDILLSNKNIVASRIVLAPVADKVETSVAVEELNSVDHIKAFSEFIFSELGNADTVISELNEISK